MFKKDELDLLRRYQDEFNHSYKSFKNGPFPRLESEIDLMVGTEGQLGVITEAIIKVLPSREKNLYFKTSMLGGFPRGSFKSCKMGSRKEIWLVLANC